MNRIYVPSARLIKDDLESSRVDHSEGSGGPGYQQSEIWESSKELENFIQGNSVDLLNIMPSSSFAATSVAMILREWLEVSEPTMLWIHGKPTNKYPSEFSILAGSLINAAMEAKAPTIFHFCEPIKDSHKQKEFTLEQAAAVSLVYGLIRQLIGVLAPEVDSFSQLKNPLANWKAALSLLSDLLDLAPAVLLCVIDGLEYIDYGKGKIMCDEILETLGARRQVAEDKSLIFNVLFTTAGSSGSLGDFMRPNEVVCDEVSRYQSYGKAGPRQKSFLG
ncbi:phytanoyl- dioxygenase family protein [Rutstroemia sp. NJR-2017a BBW]|nr:phytanoyl- dioxygenase family protein [Rutstroemia sp. NJR-2017a BBW]